ncbi:sugar-binding protein [Treponema sp.]|uniref:sugar-binding protein n=1 Tax=Treponema sp. TaxID=166 RepID=UPI0025DFE8A5|nr:sugar-binding protein [Treponema sp.]MCR5217357.1 hypothetical protein [Treponema sp.]
MKKLLTAAVSCFALFSLTSCLTIHAKKTVELPEKIKAELNGQSVKVEKEALSYFYYSEELVPVIDGNFSEWKGLEGVHSRQQVYGGRFNPDNADGFFVARTDGSNLYIYADVTDNDARVNEYEVPQAWRGDGIEFFFGTDTSKHTAFKENDSRVRIVPRSKSDIFDVAIGLNDAPIESSDIEAAVVFNSKGYKVEVKVPLSLLGSKELKLKQKVRADFQVNDADDGKERTGLLHWNSPNDNTYSDPSSWGDGKVIALP